MKSKFLKLDGDSTGNEKNSQINKYTYIYIYIYIYSYLAFMLKSLLNVIRA